jgi:hypothetical protein
MIWLAPLLPAAVWLLYALGARLDAWETRHARIMAARSRAKARGLNVDGLRAVLGAWGMGHRPMVASCRAACPVASGTRPPARPQSPCQPAPPAPCAVAAPEQAQGRPRGASPVQPCPDSSLINGLAAGALRQVLGARGGEFPGDFGTESPGKSVPHPVVRGL